MIYEVAVYFFSLLSLFSIAYLVMRNAGKSGDEAARKEIERRKAEIDERRRRAGMSSGRYHDGKLRCDDRAFREWGDEGRIYRNRTERKVDHSAWEANNDKHIGRGK